MASHRDLSARNQAHDDRAVQLGGLQFKISREEIAAVFASHGLQDCVFYWPNKPAQYQHHTGWCCVEFRDVTKADVARQKLHGAHFGGRPARAGRPGKAPDQASSGQPDISSTAQSILSPSVGEPGTSAITKGHVAIIERPKDIGFGWGGYDNFHQWQANGRQIDPREVEPYDWQFDVRKMVLVEEGSGKETKFDIEEGSALDRFIRHPQDGEGTTQNELKSLYAVFNPRHKPQEERYTSERGGGEW